MKTYRCKTTPKPDEFPIYGKQLLNESEGVYQPRSGTSLLIRVNGWDNTPFVLALTDSGDLRVAFTPAKPPNDSHHYRHLISAKLYMEVA